jgi:CPA2 family monovalent cation:H+ antiporter-2/glutathione-regulated potassium-efflux system protein KefB
MHSDGFFFQAFVYLAAAVVSVPVAKRLGLGSVLGYLIAGAIIGPFGLALVGDGGTDVMHVAEFGVVMMLFVIGLELEPALLWRLRGPILGLGGLQVGLTTAAGAGAAIALGLPWQAALAIGMTFALSSTAIVLQTLQEKGWMRLPAGQSAFAVLLFQDIAVIPMLAIFPLLAPAAVAAASEGHGTLVDGLPGWGKTLAVLAAVALIVVGGRLALRPAFRVIAGTRLRELFTAATLLLVVGIALLMQQVGLSPALGTFLAGVVLATSEYRHELESDIEPFKGLLLGLFFIAVGASIDFALIASQPGTIAGLTGLVLGAKFLLLLLLARLFRMGTDQGLLFAFALPQAGEFAFVLLAFATSVGVLGTEVANPLIAVVALTMALTPVLLALYERVIAPRIGTREREARPADTVHDEGEVIIAGFDRFGNTVGRFLRANGVRTTVLDNDSDRVDTLRRLGLTVFYGDPTRMDLLHAAGIERARAVVIALDDPEKVRGLAAALRHHHPGLAIFARAADRGDAHELLDLELQGVYRETLDTSLRMGVDVLRAMGHRGHAAVRAANAFRRHDEATLRELAAMREDRARYFSTARERIAELEALIQADKPAPLATRDLGWDPTTLRAEFSEQRTASGEP